MPKAGACTKATMTPIGLADALKENFVERVEVRHCRALVALADHGSITRAARAIGVAQSTLSETLLSLERGIGARVFQRSPGGRTVLRPTGQALLPHARAVLDAAAATAEAAADKAVRQRLTVGAVESINSYLLPGPLQQLRRQWPDIETQVSTGLCEDLREAVATGKLDVAFLLVTDLPAKTQRVDQHFDVVLLGPTRLALIVAAEDKLAGRQPTGNAIANRKLLLSDPDNGFHAPVRVWLQTVGAGEMVLESAGSVDGVKRAVAAGDGVVGVVPDYAIRDEVARGVIAEVCPRQVLPIMRLEAVLPRHGPATHFAGDLVSSMQTLTSLPQ